MVIGCIYFKGDRPCKKYWEKELYNSPKFVCSRNCEFYKKINKRILLIKLDALGDVLRTTPLAEAIKKQFPDCQLTWLVAESGFSLLKSNPYIDRILTYCPENINALQCELFDILINLDKDKKATFLANKIHSKEKRGFLLSPYGTPFPINRGAGDLYKIALDNWGKKTSNKKDFHQMTFELAEIPYDNEQYFLKLDEESLEFAERFREKLTKNKPIVGINTGCGSVYPYKKWHKKGLIQLIQELNSQGKQVLIFGGKSEIDLNDEIKKKTKAINTGYNNSLMQFASLINICDVLFTGDTLAMHIGIALKKPVIAVFGPTPSQEINIPNGKKLVGNVPCLNCYNQFPCIMEKQKKPNCMQTISLNEVLDSINEFI